MSLSVCVSLSVRVFVSFAVSAEKSQCVCVFHSGYVSPVCVSLCDSHSVSVCVSPIVSLNVCVSVSLCVCLSVACLILVIV